MRPFETLRWLAALPPKRNVIQLAAGEPPLPGCDRYGRQKLPVSLRLINKRVRRFHRNLKAWVESGMPLIPTFQMHSRSPAFVLLVLAVFAFGLIFPEIFGLNSSRF